jgi:hypothetical protein
MLNVMPEPSRRDARRFTMEGRNVRINEVLDRCTKWRVNLSGPGLITSKCMAMTDEIIC